MNSPSVSLDGLSVSDLSNLQAEIAKTIRSRQNEQRHELKQKVIALVTDAGFTMGDLFPALSEDRLNTVKRKVRVRYSDGQNNWTGRGKRPNWIKEFLAKGGELSSLEVPKND